MVQNAQKTALILGSTGRFGRHMAKVMSNSGWHTILQSRSATSIPEELDQSNATLLRTDLGSPQIDTAAANSDVIVHALNPPYPQWHIELPAITKRTIELARKSNSTLIVPGNVYNYGESMPPLLTANTKQQSRGKKGQLRIAMEKELHAASLDGVQVIILRVGDFLEPKSTGNWFDTHMTSKLKRGKFIYPGKTNIPHAWGYLPDVARAATQLADIRETLPAFNDIPFSGTTLTGEELLELIETTLGRPTNFASFPWPVLRVVGLFSPLMREVVEMRYLWNTPHRLDDADLKKLLPNFQPTPLNEMFSDLLQAHKN